MSETNPNIGKENKKNLENNNNEKNKNSEKDNKKYSKTNNKKEKTQTNNQEKKEKSKIENTETKINKENIEKVKDTEKKEFVQREDEKVEEELENIKNIVQTEVDKILDESEFDDWNDLVKTAREETKQKKENKTQDKADNNSEEKKICECCGEREIDTSENPNSTYCKECRESMKSYPLNVLEILSMFIMIALIITSVWVLSQSMYTFKTAANARSYFKEGKLTSATRTFDDVDSQFRVYQENISKPILNYEAEVSYSLGLSEYEDLSSFMDKHYSDKDFTFFINPKMREIKKSVDEYNYIKDIIISCYSEQSTYEEVIKKIDKIIKDDKDHEFDKGMIDFWKYNLAIQYKKDDKTIFDWVLKMKKDTPQYASTYLPIMSEYYLRTKEYERVFVICDKMLEINSQDTNAYRDKAVAYRMKKDIPKAIKTCKEGLKINYIDASLNHQMSILKLLSNEKQEALSYAKLAFENSSRDYTYIDYANTYAACAKINGEEDTYKQLEKEVKNSGITLSDEINKIVKGYEKIDEGKKQVVDGEKKIKDIFLKGEGDIAWN